MPKNIPMTVETEIMDFTDPAIEGGPWRIKLVDGPDPRSVDGSNKSVTFNNVAPGSYRLTAQRLSTAGQPLGPEVSTPVFAVAADVIIKIEVAKGITWQVVQA